MPSNISFVDLNTESNSDNTSFNEAINTLEKIATVQNSQSTKLVEETQNIGQTNNSQPQDSNAPETETTNSQPQESNPPEPATDNSQSDGKRSPSYHTSVMNNTNYNTNDKNIFVSAENVEFIEKLYQQLKNINRGLKLNSKNISMIIVRAVEIVNTWKQIDIEQRDDVVIQALLVLIRDSNVDDDELEYLETTIKSTISMIFKSITGDVIKKKTRKDNKNRRKTNNYVKKHENENIDVDLDLFRELPWNNTFTSQKWFFHITGERADLNLPYIFADCHPTFKNRIVIQRSFRFRNLYINYEFLKNYEDPLFVGMQDEFDDLKKQIPNLEFYDPKSFYETAQIIKSSRFFIGNSSACFSVAEGLKVPRLLEASPDFPAVQPIGLDAFDFYFQPHFEKWFDYLYKETK